MKIRDFISSCKGISQDYIIRLEDPYVTDGITTTVIAKGKAWEVLKKLEQLGKKKYPHIEDAVVFSWINEVSYDELPCMAVHIRGCRISECPEIFEY